MDFAFGGSALKMLASQDASDQYMATRVPCTDTILVDNCKAYVQNYADFGFQFRRLVTGMSFSERAEVEFVDHQHMMLVGTHRVLFHSGTDALHDDEPVKVLASNPHFWGTKVMFQMISGGCPILCQGVKDRGVLTHSQVKIMRLSEVAWGALKESNKVALEKNIRDGMSALKTQMADAMDGEMFEITFSDGSLRLHLNTSAAVVLLPPARIVEELLSPARPATKFRKKGTQMK